MPGTPVWIKGRIDHRGERAVNAALIGGGRCADDRRSHERMPEDDLARSQQPFPLCSCDGRTGIDPEHFGGAFEQLPIARRFRPREQQEQLRLLRQSLQSPPETLLDLGRDGVGRREPETACQLCGRGREFNKRERVAARLGDDALFKLRVERLSQYRAEQLAGCCRGQPFDLQLWKLGQFALRVAHCEQHGNRLRLEPTADEAEDLSRGAIKPLGVINDAKQRLIGVRLGEQRQDCQRNEEMIWRATACQPQSNPESGRLRRWQLSEPVQPWSTQLLQRGERKLHFRLDPGCAPNTEVRR